MIHECIKVFPTGEHVLVSVNYSGRALHTVFEQLGKVFKYGVAYEVDSTGTQRIILNLNEFFQEEMLAQFTVAYLQMEPTIINEAFGDHY